MVGGKRIVERQRLLRGGSGRKEKVNEMVCRRWSGLLGFQAQRIWVENSQTTPISECGESAPPSQVQ